MGLFRRPPGPLVRAAKGVKINLSTAERELLGRLLDELRTVILAGGRQDVLRRLFPPAYLEHGDQEAEAEYQRLMHDDLVAARLDSIDLVRRALDEDTLLDEDGVMAFVRALNQVRLVLGTALDVSEDDDLHSIDADDPAAGEYHLYHYLSWMLEASIDSLGH